MPLDDNFISSLNRVPPPMVTSMPLSQKVEQIKMAQAPKFKHGGVISDNDGLGGKWELVKEFKGKTHKEGGINIEVSGGMVRKISGSEDPDMLAGAGRFFKNLGAGAFGAFEGVLDTVTFGATDPLTDIAYKGLQKLGGSTASEMREQDSIRGYGTTAGAITGGIVTGGATTGAAIQQGAKGLGEGVSKGSETSKFAQQFGTYVPLAGTIAGLAVGNTGYGAAGKNAAKAAETAVTTAEEAASKAGDLQKAASAASGFEKAGKIEEAVKAAEAAKTAADLATKATGTVGKLAKLSNISTKAAALGKINPYLQAGVSAFSASNQPEGLDVAQQAVRAATPFVSPSIFGTGNKEGRQQAETAGRILSGDKSSNMDGTQPSDTGGAYADASSGGRLPKQNVQLLNYLRKYGVNKQSN
jgi:hypothetical protein